MKREKFLHEQQRFSIRKYSFGVASVLLGLVWSLRAKLWLTNTTK